MNLSTSPSAVSEWVTWVTEWNNARHWRLAVDSGLLDERGRHVGNLIHVEEIKTGYAPELAGKFWLTVQPTRNSVGYGATQRSSVHETLESAVEVAHAKVRASFKAYGRKYGRRGVA